MAVITSAEGGQVFAACDQHLFGGLGRGFRCHFSGLTAIQQVKLIFPEGILALSRITVPRILNLIPTTNSDTIAWRTRI